MIEINLVPDVKRELLKARQVRNAITVVSILVGLGAIGVTVILALTVYVGQALASTVADKAIDDKYKQLVDKIPSDNSIGDINSVLTIQDQLSEIRNLSTSRILVSRIFDIITEVLADNSSKGPLNKISISDLSYDSLTNIIKLSGQSSGSPVDAYAAVLAFQRTIENTEYGYMQANPDTGSSEFVSVGLIVTGPVEGDDQATIGTGDGGSMVKFELSFPLNPEVLKYTPSLGDWKLKTPASLNVTDSISQGATGELDKEGK